jgi:hypothetical protein
MMATEERRGMNWKRGLLRLWAVSAVLWPALWIALKWNWISCSLLPFAGGFEQYAESRCDFGRSHGWGWAPFDAWMPVLGPALVAPPLLLLVGALVYWAFRGFR